MFSAYCPDLLLGQCLTDVARTPDFIVRWTFSGRTSPYILQTYCGFRVTHEGETILTQRMLFTQTDLEPPLRPRYYPPDFPAARENRQRQVFRHE